MSPEMLICAIGSAPSDFTDIVKIFNLFLSCLDIATTL